MKLLRLPRLFAILFAGSLLIAPVIAQTNSALLADHTAAVRDAQQPGGTNGSLVPAPHFEPAKDYGPEYGLGQAIAVADLNGDGYLDLVVVNYGVYDNVNVLLGNGDGTFSCCESYSSGGFEILFSGNWVAIADVNGDGKPDIVVANQCQNAYDCSSPSSVGVLFGNGDGTFQPAVTYDSGGYGASSLVVTDVNGDGDPDIVVGNCGPQGGCGTGSIGILLGNGDGTFQSVTTYGVGGSVVGSVAAADVNGDGRVDLMVPTTCQSYPACVSVLLGNGDGTFQPASTYSSIGYGGSVAIADVNGDGKLDLVVAGGLSFGAVGILMGNGDGTFESPVTYDSGGDGGTSVAIADVNGDGKPDLVVATSSESSKGHGTVGLLLGNGDGTFQLPETYSTGGYLSASVAVGDVNGDDRPDIVVTNERNRRKGISNGTVGVLLNKTQLASKTKVKTSGSPSALGQTVTFSATVTSAGLIPNGQIITFYDGTTKIGNGAISNGIATFTISSLSVGTHTIEAVYPGGGFIKSSSGTVKQVVEQ